MLAINKELSWKEFNVSLPELKKAVDALIPGKCCGVSVATGGVLNINFLAEPSEAEWQSVVDMWEALEATDLMAQAYKSKADIAAEKEQAKAAALAALQTATGLSEAQLKAILG